MTMNKQEDKLLYHYCSNEVMINILKKKQLWMTDISHSNDFNELLLFFPDIYYAIEDIYNKSPFELIYKGKKDNQALNLLLRDVDYYINKSLQKGDITSFVVCFSEKGDLLSQWRGYANDAYGFSIGFSKNELNSFSKKECFNGRLSFHKVKYIDKDNADRIIIKHSNEMLQYIKTIRTEANNLFQSRELNEEQTEYMMVILLYGKIVTIMIDSLCYKWESYQEEHEWRLYFNSITKDEESLFGEESKLPEWNSFDKDLNNLRGKIDFYSTEECILPYYPILLSELSAKPIKQVLLGPKNKSYSQDIKLLFAKAKFQIPDVSKSTITYQ